MQKIAPKNSTIINVCIIPDYNARKKCIEFSQSLKSKNTTFLLDGTSKFAHMTVFMARFGDSEILKVLDAVKNVLLDKGSFFCEHVGYFMTSGRYLEVSYRKSEEFMYLHEALIKRLKDFRINPGKPFEEGYFAPYTKEQKNNAKETGYDLARNLYRPHVTLTRYKEGKVPEIFPGFVPAKLSFNLDKVCVYKADDNGAVFELLKEFNIK